MRDAIIIGGGVIGCAVARELSKWKIDAVLLEKTADICNGQSKANTAIVHGGYDAKPGTLKAKYNVLGNRIFHKTCEELGVPYKNNTSLVVSFSDDGHEHLEELKRRGEQNGVEGLCIIGKEELKRREPNIGESALEALLVTNGGICCPYELTIAYAENASENGVEFLRETEVTDIWMTAAGTFKVMTTGGEMETRTVINCAGIHSDEIHNMVSSDKLCITGRRGQYYLIDKKYQGSFNAAVFQLPTSMGKGVLVAPTVDGTILIGPTAEDVPNKEDKRTTAEGLKNVLEAARKTWPDLPVRAAIAEFSGVRAHCDRDDFIIGEVQDAPGFFDAVGIESPGLTSAPAIALDLAEMVAKKLKLENNPDFQPRRMPMPKFRECSPEQKEELIRKNPEYARIVCRCEQVTEAEIREAIRRPVGARTVDGIKRRTRAGMGRCQAGFCTPRTVEILAEELGIDMLEVTKFGGKSRLLTGNLFEEEKRSNE